MGVPLSWLLRPMGHRILCHNEAQMDEHLGSLETCVLLTLVIISGRKGFESVFPLEAS